MTKGSARRPTRWIHEVKVEGAVTFRAGKRGAGLVAHWPGRGTLTCAPDGSAARFRPAAGAAGHIIRKLKRAQVHGLLRDLAGQLALHASAVAIDGRGVLFLGGDGAGKSTAAAEMCLAHGASLFADDAACLEVASDGVRLLPGEDDHWLTPDSCRLLGVGLGALGTEEAAGDKRHLRARAVPTDGCPLALVVALRLDSTSSDVEARRLPGGEAARLLLEAVIRFDVEDGRARRRELEQLTMVYERATFLDIARPVGRDAMVAPFVLHALGISRS